MSQSQSSQQSFKKRKYGGGYKIYKVPRIMPTIVRSIGVKPENKYYQRTFNLSPTGGVDQGGKGLNDANGMVTVYLLPVPQGSADGNRIGKKILLKNVSYSWVWNIGGGGTTPVTSPVQWGLIIDNAANGTQLVPSDAFDLSTSGNTGCMIKSDHTQKYKVLTRHFSHTANNTLYAAEWNTDWTGSNFLNFSKKKGGGIPINYYNANNGNITDCLSGAIYLYVISHYGALDWYFDFTIRAKFTDA